MQARVNQIRYNYLKHTFGVLASNPWKNLLKWLNLMKQHVFFFILLVMLGRVNQYQVQFCRSSWVETMGAFTEVTILDEAIGLETVLWCHQDSVNGKTWDKSVFQSFLCHMTYHSQLESGQIKREIKQTYDILKPHSAHTLFRFGTPLKCDPLNF